MSYDYEQLPRKRMSAGVLLWNAQEELLIVKPSYRPDWLLPGGIVEKNESPYQAALREIGEEIGLRVRVLRCVAIDYKMEESEVTESLQWIFDAGKLDHGDIAGIRPDGEEIVEYRFVSPAVATQLLSERTARRLLHCVEAAKEGRFVYLEEGQPRQ